LETPRTSHAKALISPSESLPAALDGVSEAEILNTLERAAAGDERALARLSAWIGGGEVEQVKATAENVLSRLNANLDMLRRAQKGDASVGSALSCWLEEAPAIIGRTPTISDHAREALLALAYGKNLLAVEIGRRQMDASARELSGPNPTSLEKLLAECVATCQFEVSYHQQRLARYLATEDMKLAAFFEERLDRAQRRLLGAVKSFHQVRRVHLLAVGVSVSGRGTEVVCAELDAPDGTVSLLPGAAMHGVGSI
jgi:hypothetical protein